MNSRTADSEEPLTRLYLDHGLDEASCDHFRLEENGVTFDSPWEFALMAELSMCVDYRDPRQGRCRTPIRGVVVGSAKLRNGRHETTVLFIGETEEQFQSGLTAVAG